MSTPDPVTEADAATPQLGLREKKFAKTKLALLQAALERLREKPLADITVKELCEAAEVSEATFFNYFPKKDDLLHYFTKIWVIEVSLHAREAVGEDAGLKFIERIFDYTGQQLAENPRIMLEVIGYMALGPRPSPCRSSCGGLTVAECVQAFPGVCTESISDVQLEAAFKPGLLRAIELGELPRNLDVDAALLALISTFFGVPLWLCGDHPEKVRAAYARQLKLLWVGLR
jgi:AcrR family transcriptional regulator